MRNPENAETIFVLSKAILTVVSCEMQKTFHFYGRMQLNITNFTYVVFF